MKEENIERIKEEAFGGGGSGKNAYVLYYKLVDQEEGEEGGTEVELIPPKEIL